MNRDARMIEKVTRVGQLFDFYSALLTERQREMIELYYFDDLSLAEMAEQLGVSRQAIHDNIHRAEDQMEGYERALHLLDAFQKRTLAVETLSAIWEVEKAVVPQPAQSRIEMAIEDVLSVHRL